MKSSRAWLLAALCLAIAACAPMPPKDDPNGAAMNDHDRQILVMVRKPPPHFRPYVDVSPGYDARVPQGGQRRIAEDLAQRFELKLVDDWPMPALGVDCFVLEAPDGHAIDYVLDEVARDPRVESVQAMNVFHVLAHNDPLFPLQPSARVWQLAEVHKISTGRDVRIAEIDTAVDADHPDLRGRIAMARDFVGLPPSDGEAHGTAVAGIIAARADDGIGIAGVAPDAKLFALRACRQAPDQPFAICTSFTLAKAMQFALDQAVQVINLSLGGPRDHLLERLLDVAIARNVIVVGAADPRRGSGGFPAAHTGVLAVASEGAGNLPAGVLVAPGRDVPATLPNASWGFVTGSSYAAAEVSGAVALMLERSPSMSAGQIRSALASGAVSFAQPAIREQCLTTLSTSRGCRCDCSVLAQDARATRPH